MDQTCGGSVLHDLRTSPRVPSSVTNTIRGTLLAPVNDLSMNLRLLLSLRQSIPSRPSAAAIITHMYRFSSIYREYFLFALLDSTLTQWIRPCATNVPPMDLYPLRDALCAAQYVFSLASLLSLETVLLRNTVPLSYRQMCYHALSWRYGLYVVFIALLPPLLPLHLSPRTYSYTPDPPPVLLFIRCRQSLYESRYSYEHCTHIGLFTSVT